jgi:peptide/nickel transport system substrate-binding protein
MVDAQSEESDVEKRKHMVWAIEKKLADDDARPILFILANGSRISGSTNSGPSCRFLKR